MLCKFLPIWILVLSYTAKQSQAYWYDTFQICMKGDLYSHDHVTKTWKTWVEKKFMEIRCINLQAYRKTHGHDLTARDFSNMATDKKTLMDKSFVGQSMEDYRCTLLFPASDKKLFRVKWLGNCQNPDL